MDHLARLQFIGRGTYYLGWIAAVCGGGGALYPRHQNVYFDQPHAAEFVRSQCAVFSDLYGFRATCACPLSRPGGAHGFEDACGTSGIGIPEACSQAR